MPRKSTQSNALLFFGVFTLTAILVSKVTVLASIWIAAKAIK